MSNQCKNFAQSLPSYRPEVSPRPKYIKVNAMSLGTKEARRQQFIDWITRQNGAFHATAMLPIGRSRPALEDRLREWVIRVNRRYLGRDWYTPRYEKSRMSGVVFFENGGGGWHAHMIVKPPENASALHFQMFAPFLFVPARNPLMRKFYGKPVTQRGKFHMQKIGESPEDLRRVASYDTKWLQHHEDETATNWKFLDQLCACRGC